MQEVIVGRPDRERRYEGRRYEGSMQEVIGKEGASEDCAMKEGATKECTMAARTMEAKKSRKQRVKEDTMEHGTRMARAGNGSGHWRQ